MSVDPLVVDLREDGGAERGMDGGKEINGGVKRGTDGKFEKEAMKLSERHLKLHIQYVSASIKHEY